MPNKGVPFRSEKRFLHVRQYSRRIRWFFPNQPQTVRFFAPRLP